jgi:hypothetical protein
MGWNSFFLAGVDNNSARNGRDRRVIPLPRRPSPNPHYLRCLFPRRRRANFKPTNSSLAL